MSNQRKSVSIRKHNKFVILLIYFLGHQLRSNNFRTAELATSIIQDKDGR